ncbi:tyrosine-type recombinase/integrase [Methylobacterium soli]|uniref:Site-specific integrase n=1 Tax=Methylobacterium soli TaxID=553447 RepID=A0A6L3SVW1_9HYPH|nr:tyrosine-type recombinase/integrase [Methylobacterium soli]KAB1075919.1 site-specific integrase [Methylobacterium soli]GJE41859.1 Tyrosine recombinase XerC [Methylobacterium soli]
MKGHIRERSPGRWAVILDLRDPDTGKRRRKWHSFTGTKREAQKECARLITEMQGGDYVEPSKETLSLFVDRWLDHIRSQVSPRTHERYTELARKNVVPFLGSAVLTKLRPEQISAAYAKALVSGRRDGSGGLAPRTVHHMHRILRQALGQAVKWRILARNPADAVDPPKVERAKMRAFDAHETALLLAHFRPTRMFIPVVLGALCGLRRGEVTALRWRAVDCAAGQLAIVESTEQTTRGTRSKETKSGRARRVALPSFALEELRQHRLRQAEELLRIGVRLTDDAYVFAQADGSPVQPNSLTHEFTRILALSTALPRVRFHDLRHSHATQLLASGIHPKIAQERLGHSSVGITLDLYSHVLPGMQEDAAAKVDAALRAAIDKVAV